VSSCSKRLSKREEKIMLMENARSEIVEYGKKVLSEGLTKGTAGNLSVYDPETGYMAISPSGIGYFDTKPEDVVIMDLKGNIIEGNKKPSSEHMLHAVIYECRPNARAVVHMHSMYCTVLSCLHVKLQSVHYALADAGVATVPSAPYRTYGTPELAEAVRQNIGNSDAILLENHGMVACGNSMKKAFGLASTCEWVAEVQWRCMCAGKPFILSDQDMKTVMQHFLTYGQSSPDGTRHSYNG
jgi:L-fuculose-phosphate aldolase